MSKHGKLIEPNTLQFERLLPGPIERVWEMIVDEEKRSLWFAGGPTDLKPGGVMKLNFNNSQFSPPDPAPEKFKEFGDGFESQAIIMKCEAPTLLTINWENGIVTFELEKQGAEVKFTLTHEKLPAVKEQRVGTLAGWHTHLGVLADRLEGKQPDKFWPTHGRLEKEYNQLID
ncbi:MAG: SRPBCC family protein [Cyclobacteriaceae bacterium]